MAATEKLSEFVELVRAHEPVSPNRLTELTGMWRQDIDRCIRKVRAARLLHIADFGPSPFGGNRTVKLYACGDLPDAPRPYAPKKKYSHERTGTAKSEVAAKARRARAGRLKREASRVASRDPLIEAFFGRAA